MMDCAPPSVMHALKCGNQYSRMDGPDGLPKPVSRQEQEQNQQQRHAAQAADQRVSGEPASPTGPRFPGAVAGKCVKPARAVLQQAGLQWTTAGNAGFITGLYVVFVPLLLLIFWRQRF